MLKIAFALSVFNDFVFVSSNQNMIVYVRHTKKENLPRINLVKHYLIKFV